MNRPFYTSFAWAYDLLIHEPVAERLEFVTEMWAKRGVTRGAHVLDAGCGLKEIPPRLCRKEFWLGSIASSQKRFSA